MFQTDCLQQYKTNYHTQEQKLEMMTDQAFKLEEERNGLQQMNKAILEELSQLKNEKKKMQIESTNRNLLI